MSSDFSFLFFFIFLLGLGVGSFLNVVISRLETEEGIVKKRSHCPKCGENLAWYDLIPVLSFLLLRGRCRYCAKPISVQYPLVELATGILFVFLTSQIFNFSARGGSAFGGKFLILNQFSISQFPNFPISDFLNLIFLLFITSCLIVIFVFDLKYYIIPDKIIYPAIGTALLFNFYRVLDFGHWNLFGIWDLGFGIWKPFLFYLLAGIGASASFLIIVLVTKGKGMGLGDVKLAFLMGLVLGWPKILLALFLAFLSGAVVGIFLIWGPPASASLRRVLNFFTKNSSPTAPIFGKNWKKALKSQIPFGPFLAAATVLVMLYGDKIIRYYFNLIWPL